MKPDSVVVGRTRYRLTGLQAVSRDDSDLLTSVTLVYSGFDVEIVGSEADLFWQWWQQQGGDNA